MKRGEAGNRESGMASFMVTTVLILVISLIVVGFTQVARRNQQEALDRQLSSQAFYAAESGINGAVSAVRSEIAQGRIPPTKTVCGEDSGPGKIYPVPKLDNDDVKVTCLLVDTQVDNLFYTNVTENTPTVVPLVSADGRAIAKVTITWRNPNGGATPSLNCRTSLTSPATFDVRAAWPCRHGVLRADIASQPTGSIDYALSSFFYPLKYGGALDASTAPSISSGDDGGVARGYCVDGSDPRCMASITGLNQATYYMNFRSIYNDSTVGITAEDGFGNPIEFTGQVIVDSTAKAQDVLRRIQVRVPLKPRKSSNLPGYGLESSDTLRKRFCVQPGYYQESGSGSCQ